MSSLTLADHHAMHQAGWALTLRNGSFRLERIPGHRVFKDDACAWFHVFDLALEGDELATKTLAFLEETEPMEFAAIARYMAIYRPQQCAQLRAA